MHKYLIFLAAVTLIAALTLAGCGPASPPKDLSEIDEVSEATTEESEFEEDDEASEPPAATPTEQPTPTQTEEALPTEPPKPSEPPKPAAELGFDVGNALPDFSVPLAGGGTFTLSENLGKPVFINLFATWCGPCVGEMPEINKLFKELGDQVNFLVIDIGEDEQTALDFADDNGYSLPFAYSEDGMPFGDDYLIYSIPRTFVLNADGVISAYYEGMRDYDTFKAAIQAALAH